MTFRGNNLVRIRSSYWNSIDAEDLTLGLGILSNENLA